MTANDDEELLDLLDSRAERIAHEFNSSGSSDGSSGESSTHSGSGLGSDGESEEEDPELANAAAVQPVSHKRRREFNEEEDDAVLRTASWGDMEEARKYLTREHNERFESLLHRWEHEVIEEGDDVDLNTGLIVNNTGHLQALAPQSQLSIFQPAMDDDDEEEEEEEEEEDEDETEFTDQGIDPRYTVCQKPSYLLNGVIESTLQRWIL